MTITQLYEPLDLAPRSMPLLVGLVLLETDHTTELEFARHMPHDFVGTHANRVTYVNPSTPENLRATMPLLRKGAEMILPGADLDVIYYGCTSASIVIGDDVVKNELLAAKPGATVITPTIAAFEACQHLAVHKLAVLTPYLPETSAPLQPYFEQAGFEVVNHVCLGMADDREMARLSSDTLIRAAVMADVPDADALFISCTALRSLEVAGQIETAIGKPVITSNQAAVWMTLRSLGLGHPGRNHCRLFDSLSRSEKSLLGNRTMSK